MKYKFLLLFCFVFHILSGATYYINPTGNDTTGDGSHNSPYKTFNKALTVAGNNDYIVFQFPSDGTATYTINATQTIDKNINLYSYVENSEFVVNSANTDPSKVVIGNDGNQLFQVDGSTVLIKGLRFKDCTSNSRGTIATLINSSGTINVEYCDFINVNSTTHGGVFYSSRLGNINSEYTVFANCSAGNSSDGGVFYQREGSPTITNNTFYSNSAGEGSVIYFRSTTGYNIEDNIFANNSVSNSSSGAIHRRDTGTYTINYNCFYGNNYNTNSLTTSNNITGDPLFYNTGSNDFRISNDAEGNPSSCHNTSSSSGDVGARAYYDASTVPVEFYSFSLLRSPSDEVIVKWITQTELDLRGFYVYRNEVDDYATAIKMSDLITATNSSLPTEYTWEDEFVALNQRYYYWIETIAFNGDIEATTASQSILLAYEEPHIEVPEYEHKTGIVDVYPNPFNPPVNISFYIDEEVVDKPIDIQIFNVKGQRVHNRDISAKSDPGVYTISWNGKDESSKTCGSGIYLVKFTAGKHQSIKKSIKLK